MNGPGIILLAAGSSSRLGQPKQLAIYNGKSLISYALSQAEKVTKNTMVVLGSGIDLVKKEIAGFQVQIIHNKNWEDGMASSICLGLSEFLKDNPSAGSVIFMVCDQPFVNAPLLKTLISTYEVSNKPIVACSYENTVGTPVLFDKLFFPELLALAGQAGAKKIISQNMGSVITIPFPLGHIDIDTREDYEALQTNKFNS
jgi:molybdenum cofactor cytidylyltransferase